MEEPYQSMVEARGKQSRNWYFGFFGSYITGMNLFGFWIIYSLEYDKQFNDIYFRNLVFTFLGLTLVFFIIFINKIYSKPEIIVWKKILEDAGINYSAITMDHGIWYRFDGRKMIVVAQSYFKERYPEVYPHLLPQLKYNWFKKPLIIEFKEFSVDNHLKEELKISGLWIQERSKGMIISIIITILAFATMIIMTLIGSDTLLTSLDDYDTIIFLVSGGIAIVSAIPFAYYYKKYYLPVTSRLDKILDEHHIVYSSDNRDQEIAELIAKHYPYVDLSQYKY